MKNRYNKSLNQIEDNSPELLNRIASDASSKAIAESEALGLPIMYVREDGKIVRKNSKTGRVRIISDVKQSASKYSKGDVIRISSRK